MSNFSFLKDEFNVLYNESYKSESVGLWQSEAIGVN